MALAPDGQRLATGFSDGSARVWDLATGQEVLRLEDGSSVESVAFAPDGRRLATGSDDSTVRTWDLASGRELLRLDGHEASVKSVAFTPDGRRLATGSDDSTARIWDLASGQELLRLEGHGDWVTSVAFAPDGRRLATGSQDKTARVWDLATGREVLRLDGHEAEVTSVAFTPDGRRLATGSRDNTARVWDLATGREMLRLKGHWRAVLSVAFSPDGQRLATGSGSGDNTARIWDAATGREMLRLEGHWYAVMSLAFAPDGQRLATGSADNTARMWDLASGREVLRLEAHGRSVYSVAFAPNGRRLATGSSDGSARVWDLASGRELLRVEAHGGEVQSVAFAPDGRRLATGLFLDSVARVWDLASGRELLRLENGSSVWSVAFAPDGRRLATGSLDNTARVWDLASGRELLRLEIGSSVESVAFAPDGQRLATGSWDTVQIWDLATGRELQRLEGHESGIESVAFSPDGQRLATGSSDNTARVWDLATGREMLRLEQGNWVTSVAFSPDGQLLAIGSWDGTARIWNWRVNREEVRLFAGGRGNWVGCSISRNLCLRHDDGTLVMAKDGGHLSWVAPSALPDPPIFTLIRNGNVVSSEGRLQAPYVLRNDGGDAWAVQIRATPRPPGTNAGGPPAVQHIVQYPVALAGRGATKPMTLSFLPFAAQENPRSGDVNVDLTIVDIRGETDVPEDLMLHVPAAELHLQSATLLPSDANAQPPIVLQVTNGGDVASPGLVASLTLLEGTRATPIQGRAEVPGLAPQASREIPFAIPEDLQRTIREAQEPPRVQVALATDLQDSRSGRPQSWRLEAPLNVETGRYLFVGLFAAGAFLLLAVSFAGIRQHPLVVKLTKDPQALFDLSPQQLSRAGLLLQLSSRKAAVLETAGVSKRRFNLGTEYADPKCSAEERIKLLSDRLELRVHRIQSTTPGLQAWIAQTPEHLLLNLPEVRLIVPDNGLDGETIIARISQMQEYSNRMAVLIVGGESLRAEAQQLVAKRGLFAVVPTAWDITRILIGRDPLDSFTHVIAAHVTATRISLYQTGLGVSTSAGFFGRDAELSHILNRPAANYFLVGGRQVGKSSILKELLRRFDRRGETAFYVPLNGPQLSEQLAEALKCNTGDIELTLRAQRAKQTGPVFVLIDEADQFVEAEIAAGQAALGLLRKLSEEGVACFVLAGFWELYRLTTIEYQSVLKNFGERLEIAALDPTAARKLVTEPMEALGLQYADSALVERILERSGRRANLLVLTCAQLIRTLPPEARRIDAAQVEAALNSDQVEGAVGGWGRLSGGTDPFGDALDSLVVQAVAGERATTLRELQRLVTGRQVTLEGLNGSLARLRLAYVVLQDDAGQLRIAVPLLQNQLDESDLDEAIAQQIRVLPAMEG